MRITVLVAVLIAVAASVFPIGKLEEMVNVGTLFAFVLVSAGVIILRRSRPDLKRGFRVPWVPLVPIASIVACVWLMLNLTALTWIRFLIWMALGVVIYSCTAAVIRFRGNARPRRNSRRAWSYDTRFSNSLATSPHSVSQGHPAARSAATTRCNTSHGRSRSMSEVTWMITQPCSASSSRRSMSWAGPAAQRGLVPRITATYVRQLHRRRPANYTNSH